MYTLTTYFDELLKSIEPPPDRLAAAQEVPDRVRDYLKDCEGFCALPPYSQLSGSYRRHVAVGNIKDVDIIVKADAGLDDNPGSVIRGLKNALDRLPEALGLRGYAEARESRRSVHVYFEDKDFHLDVVPAIIPGEFDENLYIPDKSWGKWIESNPLGYCKYLSELNERNSGKVVPLIKLVKHFRDYQMKIMKPKSYWLEALVVYHVVNGSVDARLSLAEMFRDLMSAIYAKFAPLLGRTDGATPHIPDPMLGIDISWNWDRTHFETFMHRVEEARDLAKKALETGDKDLAVETWQRLFGEERFPSDVKAAAKNLAKAVPGVATVTATGLVSLDRPTSGAYTVTRATRFYGET